MTKDEALKLALEAFESMNHEDSIFRGEFDDKVAAIKEALALQALHAENERLGLYKEAYAQQEPVAWVDLLKEAQQIVESKVLYKKFIAGTPLSNDIACWMAAFAQAMPDWADFKNGRAKAFEEIANKVKEMPWENDTKDSFLIWLKEQT